MEDWGFNDTIDLLSPRRFELLLHRYQQWVLTDYTIGLYFF